MKHNLDRFIYAQNNIYETALNEIKEGKKKTHWMWYIFPQMKGLGKSFLSQYYGINGREEALEYIKNDILRERLIKITEEVYYNKHSVYDIFEEDAIKFRSCMLLFNSISNISIFKKVINKYNWN